jgi:hypothetical protein
MTVITLLEHIMQHSHTFSLRTININFFHSNDTVLKQALSFFNTSDVCLNYCYAIVIHKCRQTIGMGKTRAFQF